MFDKVYDSERGKLIETEGSSKKTGIDLIECENGQGQNGDNGESESVKEADSERKKDKEEDKTRDNANGEEEVCDLKGLYRNGDRFVI